MPTRDETWQVVRPADDLWARSRYWRMAPSSLALGIGLRSAL
jgi:hypothetical protein